MKKWVHIIGVAGVSTSGVAIMFKDLGWKVTGSDKGFFPPVSTYLEENEINIQPGFKPERLNNNGKNPDLVVYQGVVGDKNTEYVYAKEKGLKIRTFAEVLSEYVELKKSSIVVTGTYGKTTITSALVTIFQQAKKDVSYMFGGLSTSIHKSVRAKNDKTEFSIIEGDEYLNSLQDRESKFFKYSPDNIIINAVQWEHTDLFETEGDYIENFVSLVKTLPDFGLVVANANDKNTVEVAKHAKCRVVYYSEDEKHAEIEPDWVLLRETKPLPTFVRKPQTSPAEIIPYEKQIIGDFNEENLLAASALAYEIGIKKERIQEAIENYTGIRRRLEKRLDTENAIVIDDFGSSPPKAAGALKALNEDYPEREIIAVFEPNTGNRTLASLPLYETAFENANEVILPRFTRLPKTRLERFGAEVLFQELQKYHHNVKNINDDNELIEYLVNHGKDKNSNTVIVFLGSHGFRTMIEKVIEKLT